MKASLCNTAVIPCIDLLRKKRMGQLKKEDVEVLLLHEDYGFEFRRYEGRVSQQEFTEYFLTFETLAAEQIPNMDLRNHHNFWLDLYENLDWFEEHAKHFFETFNPEVIEEAYQTATAGFPQGYNFSDCKVVFTCGIGQSFGYANENGMHFDIMQLFRKYENEHFKDMIAHELHHLIFLDNIEFDESNLENYFLQWFAIEGLAIKFTGNAQGVLSRKLHPDQPANWGLDEDSMMYLNAHFESAFSKFKQDLADIRSGKIGTLDAVRELLVGYWFSLYADGQGKDEIPKLKQTRLYAMGNDLWGTIYDIYGMNTLYETLNHPETFLAKFNGALCTMGKEKYLIN